MILKAITTIFVASPSEILKSCILETRYFPVYTQVSPSPKAICEKLTAAVFDYPFFNDAVPLVRPTNPDRKEWNLKDPLFTEKSNLLKINGFIFHTSHCGSTLLAQMLATSEKIRVVSETEAINGLLLWAVFHQADEATLLAHLKTIVAAYLQPLGTAENVVFKLTSWNVFFRNLFQKAFPNVPQLFIDRKTADVVESLQKAGGGFVEWWYHPTDLLRKYFLGAYQSPATIQEYLATMVELHRKFGSDPLHPILQVEYPTFLDHFQNRILPHFRLNFSKEAIVLAEKRIGFEAKSFEPIPFSKR